MGPLSLGAHLEKLTGLGNALGVRGTAGLRQRLGLDTWRSQRCGASEAATHSVYHWKSTEHVPAT